MPMNGLINPPIVSPMYPVLLSKPTFLIDKKEKTKGDKKEKAQNINAMPNNILPVQPNSEKRLNFC
jgi:hypothetical protein